MNPALRAALTSWTFDPWLWVPLCVGAVVYLRGFRQLRRQLPHRFPSWRAWAYLAGLAVVFVAAASPLEAFSGLLLQVHMLQHWLLVFVAPPLILLGAPMAPLLRGLPRSWLREGLGPFLAWKPLQRMLRGMVHPLFTWPLFIAVTWGWHAPVLYERALLSPDVHRLEHACFLAAALIFWWPVVQPWPARPAWPRWTAIPYLFLGGLANTAFSAVFTFSDRVLYPSYALAPRVLGVSALDDQAASGALMWVGGGVVMLLACVGVAVAWLEPRHARPRRRGVPSPPRPTPLDLLRVRALGPILRWRGLRRALQLVLFALAAAIVVDGLLGPQASPLNLAGVLPWTHWRGLVVIALLVAGNLFCMACPFLLPRELARRLRPARREWPRALRSKWPALALLVLYLAAYEAFDLWASPWWTAWVVVGYFVAALCVDAVFRGASFCKYVCPIGQFHFVHATLSPLEVRVREPDVCTRCRTHDCLRGNPKQRGCELELFQPAKVGNLDCTFCLDCVHACPHDNVGVLPATPGRDLWRDPVRSSLRRLSQRPDVTALAAVFAIGAFVNAAGMVGSLPEAGASAGVWIGLLLAAAAALGALGGRLALALVPVGFAMWLAHLGFHFVTGLGSAVPVVQRAALDAGVVLLGEPAWPAAAMGARPDWLLPLELLALDAGLLLSLYVAWRIVRADAGRGPAWLRWLPWGALGVGLFAAGVWILHQPMQMRGMMMMG